MKRVCKIISVLYLFSLPFFDAMADNERITIPAKVPSTVSDAAVWSDQMSTGSLRGGDFPPDGPGIGEEEDPIGALPVVLIAAASGLYGILRKKRT